MGIWINPGNSAFEEVHDSQYIDKTGLIRLVSETIKGHSSILFFHRPYRFGTFADTFRKDEKAAAEQIEKLYEEETGRLPEAKENVSAYPQTDLLLLR